MRRDEVFLNLDVDGDAEGNFRRADFLISESFHHSLPLHALARHASISPQSNLIEHECISCMLIQPTVSAKQWPAACTRAMALYELRTYEGLALQGPPDDRISLRTENFE